MSLAIPAFLFSTAAFLGYFYLGGFAFGAGFGETPRGVIERAAKLSDLKPGMLVYDLGSGLASPLIYLAEEYGARCVGYEMDPLKCAWSKARVRRRGLGARVRIERRNLLEANLAEADLVFVFLSGGTGIMEKIARKAREEMKPGSKVASYLHRFESDWQPSGTDEDVRVYSVTAARCCSSSAS